MWESDYIHVDVMVVLVHSGADVTTAQHEGTIITSINGYYSVTCFLLQKRANPYIQINNINTMLFMVPRCDIVSVMELLLQTLVCNTLLQHYMQEGLILTHLHQLKGNLMFE